MAFSFHERLPYTLFGAAAILAGALSCSGCVGMLWLEDDEDLARCAPIGAAKLEAVTSQATGDGEKMSVAATSYASYRTDITLQGKGDGFVGGIDVNWGLGTIDLGCASLPLIVTDTHGNGTFFDAVASDGEALFPLQFLCSDDGKLEWVRYETTSGIPPTYEEAEGRCQLNLATSKVFDVRFPKIDLALPNPLGGYTVEGPDIHLPDGAVGTVTVDGSERSLLAFDVVDCNDCNSPWWQIQALLIPTDRASVTFAKLLLDSEDHSIVLEPEATLPMKEDASDWIELTGTFTTPYTQ